MCTVLLCLYNLYLHVHPKRTKQEEYLGFFELAVPVFHAYGHKLDCQVSVLTVNICPSVIVYVLPVLYS